MRLKILLLQARHADDPVRAEERQSFADKTGLDPERIVPHDLLAGSPDINQARRHDAVMVGGSGDFSISNGDLPHLEGHLEFLRELVDQGHPLFASCFGFHLLVEALGGQIVHDPANTEVGTYDLELTAAGRRDPLFGVLPPKFAAQMGRKDRAGRLPEGLPNLARSQRNPHQAFRIPGKPMWATQFHPELDATTNLGRFKRYLKGYSEHLSPEERQERLRCFHGSPETERLLPRFLQLVFG